MKLNLKIWCACSLFVCSVQAGELTRFGGGGGFVPLDYSPYTDMSEIKDGLQKDGRMMGDPSTRVLAPKALRYWDSGHGMGVFPAHGYGFPGVGMFDFPHQ